MKRGPLLILGIAVAAAALVVARYYVARRPCAPSASTARLSLSFNGQMALDFALESVDGNTVHLSDFQGKAVLLNFWATSWRPSKYQMYWFEQMHKQYEAQGLQVIGIAMDGAGKEKIAEFANNLGVDYTILIGKENVGEAYGAVQVLPVTIYVGRDGKVVERVVGPKCRDEIENNVKKALDQGR